MHQYRGQVNSANMGRQGPWKVVANRDNSTNGRQQKSKTVQSGTSSSSARGTYITTPPIFRPHVTPEHSETEDDQPLDFSMKKKPTFGQNVKNAARNLTSSLLGSHEEGQSKKFDQPIDLTLKTIKEEPATSVSAAKPWNVVKHGFSPLARPQVSPQNHEAIQSMSSRHMKSSSSPQVNVCCLFLSLHFGFAHFCLSLLFQTISVPF